MKNTTHVLLLLFFQIFRTSTSERRKQYLFIYLFILLRLGVTYIYIYKKKTLMTITKPGRDTTTVRTNYCGK